MEILLLCHPCQRHLSETLIREQPPLRRAAFFEYTYSPIE